MTDDNDSNRQAPASGGRTPLTLKPRIGGAVSAGVIKQSFSHGRSKTVVVETKRRRADTPVAAANPAEQRPSPIEKKVAPTPTATIEQPASTASGGLSEDERRARQRAIELAREQQQRVSAQLLVTTPIPSQPVIAETPIPAPVEQPKEVAPPVSIAPIQVINAPSQTATVPPPDLAPTPPRPRPIAAAPPRASAPSQRAPDGQRSGGQTRTYEPSRERRDDRASTTTYRPERPSSSVAFNQRTARPGEAASSQRPEPSQGSASAPSRDRSARPGETVRYSALAPRPPRDGAPRPGSGRPVAAPDGTPEVQRATRQAPRSGALSLDRRPDFDEEDARKSKTGAGGKAVSRTKGEPRRREGRLTIQAVAGDDEGAVERMRSLASVRRAREREREKRKGGGQEAPRRHAKLLSPTLSLSKI